MKTEINSLLIEEFSYIYNDKGEKFLLSSEHFGGVVLMDMLTPLFFLHNSNYVDEMRKIKTTAIKDDFVLDYYQNESGAVYLSFILIVSVAAKSLKLCLSEKDFENALCTTLKLSPEILYQAKYNDYFGHNAEYLGHTKPEPPKSYLSDYQNLPEDIKKIFSRSSVWFRGMYYGINRSFNYLSKYDSSIREKQGILLNPIIDGVSHCICPILDPEST